MHGMEGHPTLIAKVLARTGEELEYRVKVIVPTMGKAYALMDKDDQVMAASVTIKDGQSSSFIQFSGLWIENNEVHGLNILSKEKIIYIGKLLSLT